MLLIPRVLESVACSNQPQRREMMMQDLFTLLKNEYDSEIAARINGCREQLKA